MLIGLPPPPLHRATGELRSSSGEPSDKRRKNVDTSGEACGPQDFLTSSHSATSSL